MPSACDFFFTQTPMPVLFRKSNKHLKKKGLQNKPFTKKNQETGLQNKSSPKTFSKKTVYKTSLHQKRIPVQVYFLFLGRIQKLLPQKIRGHRRCSRKICALHICLEYQKPLENHKPVRVFFAYFG